ncbi:hypothetical protein OPT61_g1943 [Boeremia exigua]|uniref:Uncharacterized protein n=1 Tax=Boeremia exigua TaxID=749465 RepID=A0ACC2INI3_9PLEO|nr:hypothetical protein OPT61_g1943 [Boeremia exigua]
MANASATHKHSRTAKKTTAQVEPETHESFYVAYTRYRRWHKRGEVDEDFVYRWKEAVAKGVVKHDAPEYPLAHSLSAPPPTNNNVTGRKRCVSANERAESSKKQPDKRRGSERGKASSKHKSKQRAEEPESDSEFEPAANPGPDDDAGRDSPDTSADEIQHQTYLPFDSDPKRKGSGRTFMVPMSAAGQAFAFPSGVCRSTLSELETGSLHPSDNRILTFNALLTTQICHPARQALYHDLSFLRIIQTVLFQRFKLKIP